MRMRLGGCVVLSMFLLVLGVAAAREQPNGTVLIPKTWDDPAIATHEVPLANPIASPRHVSSDYYYRIPVRPIYKGYSVYALGREPAGYLDWLKRQDPAIVWDDRGNAPSLQNESDWIRAGEIVFDSPTGARANIAAEDVRNPKWLETIKAPVAADGTLPWFQYVIRSKGEVTLSASGCAFCHTRVMPDGSIIKGAQGNLPVQRAVAFRWRAESAAASDKQQYLSQLRTFLKRLHAAPYLRPDPEDRIDTMSVEDIAALFDTYPPSVAPRHRGNSFTAIQVPDLIGVKDRRYLDRTGLEIHRSIGDMMRYAAMNMGADSLASYAGFVPADGPRFQQVPPPERSLRYSDEQLYALARYVYSLQPPANPNRFDTVAASGERIFEREGCARCHTPPLYTNNKLTPADGFTIPPEHRQRYDIMSRSIGTDPELTLRTRRGTGYYKVPSLKGVWYRSSFGHSGWCATLEDWFDPGRVRDDYVPTAWKPYGRQTYGVKGHPFGLKLEERERRALIAFLKTL
jgi:cytochrome c551/c552